MTGAQVGAERGGDGTLALVLHAHMPYVEGFGTWPFGEEWLWEAVATVYLPLIELLRGAPVTLGSTPVLCDQLETLTGRAGERFLAFMRDTRLPLHAEDAAGLERGGQADAAAELRRAAGDYEWAVRSFEGLGGDLVGALGDLAVEPSSGRVRGMGGGAPRRSDAGGAPRRDARTAPELMASVATHAVLPLLATTAGRRLQVEVGAAAHARRFGRRAEVFWLPECAYEPGLETVLAEHGVRAFCVDQTDVHGLGALEQLEPVATESGPVAVPIDWATVALVWDERSGYPVRPGYRNYHGRTTHDLRPWDNAGRPYDAAAGRRSAAEDARDFLRRVAERLARYRDARGRPGLLCCPLDAELLGHWWYEGQVWLATVIEEAAAHGVELLPLSAALERVEPVTRREPAPSTWGSPKDLTTWDSPRVADLVRAARRGELELLAGVRTARDASGAAGEAGEQLASGGRRSAADPPPALARAARELLALQSSDWAFQVTRELAADYPVERARAHERELDRALRAAVTDSAPEPDPRLRNLAPELDLSPLLAP